MDESDAITFAADALPRLREAVADLSWLRGRGYSETAAVTLVGDRFQLTRRQRSAVQRAAVSDEEREARWRYRQRDIAGQRVVVDGFNVLRTVEHAIDGGAVLRGRDGVLRDLAGLHGPWRRRGRTGDAILALRAVLSSAAEVVWMLDAPVPNSGRLAQVLRRSGIRQVEVVPDCDARLLAFDGVRVTGDGPLLAAGPWFAAVDQAVPASAWIVDLGRAAARR
jgi:hypothetical protein